MITVARSINLISVWALLNYIVTMAAVLPTPTSVPPPPPPYIGALAFFFFLHQAHRARAVVSGPLPILTVSIATYPMLV